MPSPHEGMARMTNANPPENNRGEHTKWWETPSAAEPAAGHSGMPPSDPTMVNPNTGVPRFPSDQHQHPAAGQYPSAGQQYPSGGQQYPSGLQHPGAGGHYPSPTPQAGGHPWPPGPQGPSPAFPGSPGYPGARSSKNTTALIILGVVLLVVVLICGGGGIALLSSAAGTDEPKEWKGDYSMESVTNACDLVDATVLDQWAATLDETTHQESAPSSYGGGSLTCRISNEGADTNSARLTLDVGFAGEYTTYGYDDWKKSDTATTGTDYDSGTVNGLGEEAYYASQHSDYSSFDALDYTVAAKDSNVSVKVTLYINSQTPINRSTVDQVCRDQVRKVLDGLRK